MRDAETMPAAAALRGDALLGYLEDRAREELAAVAAGLADAGADADITSDPMLACMDWDLGVAGTVLPGGR